MQKLEEQEQDFARFNRWIWDLNPSGRPPYSIPPGQPQLIRVNEAETYVGHNKPRSLNDEIPGKDAFVDWPVHNAPKYPARSVITWYLPCKNGVIQIKNFYDHDVFIGSSRKKMSIEKLLKLNTR